MSDPLAFAGTGRVPAVGTAEFDEWTMALGQQLAEWGARPVERHLAALARRARECQVQAVSAAILADRNQPEVARARAFSRVVAALGALGSAIGDRSATSA